MSSKAKTTVKCFKYDSWEEVNILDLKKGDTFVYKGETYISTDKPFFSDEVLNVPAEIYDSGAIFLALEKGRDFIHMAMDYTSSSAHNFGDGTMQICEFGGGKTNIYSPRLPIVQLNDFCKENIKHYESFFSKYEHQLDRGDAIEMAKFW